MQRIHEMDEGIRPYDYFNKVMGGKWKPFIIRGIAFKGFVRFNELTYILGVTPKVLKQQLDELENDGIIERVVYNQVPPRVDYVFTEEGKELVPIYDMIYKWALKRLEEKKEKVAPYSYVYHQNDKDDNSASN